MKDYNNYHTQSVDKIENDAIEIFNLHLNGDEGVYGHIDELAQRFVVQKHVSEQNKYIGKVQIMCLSNINLHTGSLVNDNISNYIVTSLVNDNKYFKNAELEICTNTLNFYDKTSVLNDIISVPCVVSSTTISSASLDDQTYFSNLQGKIVVQIPNNTSTSTIYEGQRFILGKYVYEVANIDDITSIGLLKINMQITETNNLDNFVTGVAYNEGIVANNYALKILNGSSISFNTNQNITLSVEVSNNGTVISPTPSLIYSSSDINVCTVDSNGVLTGLVNGTCQISVALTSEPNLKATVDVEIVSTITHNYSVNIMGVSQILKNKSAQFGCTFSDNGVTVLNTSIFTLLASDGITPLSNSIAYIISQDSVLNNCNIQVLNPSGIVYFYVSVSAIDGSCSTMKKIKIYSLI